jgi:uncharacterized membrane protein YccC
MESTNEGNRGSVNRRRHNTGRVIGGIVILMVGLAILARQMDLELPYWLFSWPMILVVIGLYIGGRETFKPGGWMVVVAVGAVFLADDVLDYHDLNIGRYFWPAIVIAIGLYMIFKPRRREWSPDNALTSAEQRITLSPSTSKAEKSRRFLEERI